VLFLCPAASSYVNGAVIPIDGGSTAASVRRPAPRPGPLRDPDPVGRHGRPRRASGIVMPRAAATQAMVLAVRITWQYW